MYCTYCVYLFPGSILVSHPRLSYHPKRERESESCTSMTRQLYYCAAQGAGRYKVQVQVGVEYRKLTNIELHV